MPNEEAEVARVARELVRDGGFPDNDKTVSIAWQLYQTGVRAPLMDKRHLRELPDALLAAHYFNDMKRPQQVREGWPTSIIDKGCHDYAIGASENAEAMRQIREHYGIES